MRNIFSSASPTTCGGRFAPARDADVGARLAEVHRQQLRVAVGEVQQRDVAEAREVVDRLVARRRAKRAAGPAAAAAASACRNSRRDRDISESFVDR